MKPVAIGSGPLPVVTRLLMPVVARKKGEGLQASLAVTLRNGTGTDLPPGEATGYLTGEFIGFAPFRGARPNETVDLVFGATAGDGDPQR